MAEQQQQRIADQKEEMRLSLIDANTRMVQQDKVLRLVLAHYTHGTSLERPRVNSEAGGGGSPLIEDLAVVFLANFKKNSTVEVNLNPSSAEIDKCRRIIR
jgi:hypothetical protein